MTRLLLVDDDEGNRLTFGRNKRSRPEQKAQLNPGTSSPSWCNFQIDSAAGFVSGNY
jgi:hypothetical protein